MLTTFWRPPVQRVALHVRYVRIIVADPLEGGGGDCHTYQALQ